MYQFNQIIQSSISLAQAEALQRKNTELYPLHLLWGLVENPQTFLSKKFKNQKGQIIELLSQLPNSKSKISIDQLRPNAELSEWLTMAMGHAAKRGQNEIAENDLLAHLVNAIPSFKFNPEILNVKKNGEEGEEGHEGEEIEQPHFLINFNELAEKGKLDPVIGRAREIRAVMEILGRRNKNNPILVGPAGVGKTAIAEGLALEITKGQVPDVLKEKIVYSLDLGMLMAGTKYRGEFEERIQQVLKFIKSQNGNGILFIDEIHQLVGAGRTDGAMDAANLLKPALARGELHCIGATTPEEFQKYIMSDSALERRFRSVPVEAPSTEEAIEILMGIREKLEIHHGIKISDDSLHQAVLLSNQYIPDKNLPDKAIDLIDEAASALKLSAESMPRELMELEAEIKSKNVYLKSLGKSSAKEKEVHTEIQELTKNFNQQKLNWDKEVSILKSVAAKKQILEKYKFDLELSERKQDYEAASRLKYMLIPEIEKEISLMAHDFELKAKDVALVISRQKGIPVEKILKSKQERILELESYLKKRIFGQGPSLHEISEVVTTSHAGLTKTNRPLGSFLLSGSSGVGKTQTAKALAQFLFDSEESLIRFDLSEFQEKHSVSKLIGAPAGYVGYDEGGILTERIRRRPYAVILFDEVEKAHRDFGDILLQILDDGRLTDNKGRTIDFKNTIIILTTNSKNIKTDFKPEVLGRLDAVLEYRSLGEDSVLSIIENELSQLNDRLSAKNILLELSTSVKSQIAMRGVDPDYGARPLQNVFLKMIMRPLGVKLLKGECLPGVVKGEWDDKINAVKFI